ncbi:MAG: arylsulfatase [Pseudomonadota bacterium]
MLAAGAVSLPALAASPEFKGKIAVDIRDSVPDWSSYMNKKAPAGAPNILLFLYDDVGQAAVTPYGGAIHMPMLERLAANGLTYTQWHTAALSSPTRATLMTGRNHHLVGSAAITEATIGFPGGNGRIPDAAVTLAQLLQANGYATFMLGKNHNVPAGDVAEGGARDQWPLQKGFDRFYGFFGGETSQYYPDLVEDNHFIPQPYTPAQGYHLSKDLADHAIKMIQDQKSTNPSKPFFMWMNPGAGHAPHQAPEAWIAKYKGKFDAGYEAYRDWTLQRATAKGTLPAGTKLTPLNPLDPAIDNPIDRVRPWNSLTAEEKKLFARMAETWAGFLEYTDSQMERVVDYLKQTGQLENTMIIWASDNGSSGEGSPNGSANENKFFNGYPDSVADNVKFLNQLGGLDTYQHMPTGWAAAFSTPYKMFKRYAQFAGGTEVPMVISWPKGIKARGELRNQYHHSVDLVPTILETLGIAMPAQFRGVDQIPLSGVSMKYSFDAKPDDPTHKHRQYYTMLGTRGLWQDGWKLSALHAPTSGKGHFEQDAWELYHVDVDRSESTDLAAKYPEKVRELARAYEEEAVANQIYPLDDRKPLDIVMTPRPTDETPKARYVYLPFTAQVPEPMAVDIRGRSYKIIAKVDLTDANASGVLLAHGTRFGGHTLFIKDHRLHYVYNFLGLAPDQDYVSDIAVTPGKHTLGMAFDREGSGKFRESLGTMTLFIDGQVVAKGAMRTQAGRFTLSGDGLSVGYDYGDGVSSQYAGEGRFAGGTIESVLVSTEAKQYLDLKIEAERALHD